MTKVLVVDDSALLRRVLSEILTEAGFEVAIARDGVEALAKLDEVRPDVVTLDVQMPRMNGLECLEQIMARRPCPVVMVSSLTAEGAEATLSALELGAVDFLPKPDGVVSLAIDELAPVLIEKVTAAATAKVGRGSRLLERLRARREAARAPTKTGARPRKQGAAPAGDPPEGLVLVGTSTGGPAALEALLGDIAPDFPWPILVAQHMPASFTASLAARLDGLCPLSVVEAAGPTPLRTGGVYIARGGADMVVSRRAAGLVALPAPADPAHRWHPSVDRLVASAMAHVAPDRLVGVLMTGMGDDGARTMAELHRLGGRTVAESEETAVVWGMPGALVRLGGASAVEPVDAIAGRLSMMLAR
ncbi:protein-glutamate methylesterase/protein-glutamine glutaminase [Caulobacter hibisci]|uniref:Protein-glutamate methylesterase/protein-glutamine glutaminase n=1 Tax=Caulobacter hibisci TaxID=2035993 RepID=A0ABS0T237_9CAUL|nr:chemotaxis response regulator protein-glutamate methylesterase [Caulobacter hibisci]MBI1684973.1 chemotaxis response regulator protein-glutamate methylesterase [Caulobacter hibisci]